MNNIKPVTLFIIVFLFLTCNNTTHDGNQNTAKEVLKTSGDLPIDNIKLPKNFKISLYASDITDARSLALGAKGTIFVGNRRKDKVYALQDTNNDYQADRKYIIASGLNMPNGVAFRNNDLYVAEVNRILKFANIENHLHNPGKPEVIYDQYPTDRHHGWKFIRFGPDGKLYVPVGAPCNICESKSDIYASITSIYPNGAGLEIFAKGVRNTVGFDWHPETGQLWFTDNGRDWLGDNFPPCELNHAPQKGMHFGYPYCHGSDIADPEFGGKYACTDFIKPAQNLGAHVAPLGMRFYTDDMFPEEYKNQILIAEHGSWNRSRKAGYRITSVKLKDNKSVSYEVFAEGWLDEEKQEAWGRPVDLLVMPDGSLLISDDKANAIYRVYYSP